MHLSPKTLDPDLNAWMHCRYIYSRQAAIQLGKNPKHLGIPFASEWIRNKAHNVKTNFGAISAAVSLMTINEQAAREVQPNWTEEQAAAYMEQKMGKVQPGIRGFDRLSVSTRAQPLAQQYDGCVATACYSTGNAVSCCCIFEKFRSLNKIKRSKPGSKTHPCCFAPAAKA